jgi:FkbM family methyltransferase
MLKRYCESFLALILNNDRIVRALLARIPQTILRQQMGRDYLSPIQKFALDGYNKRIFQDLPLNSDSKVIVLGGFLGDSAAEYREIYDASVFITEPISDFFAVMEKRFKGDNKVHLFNEASTAESHELEIFISGERTGVFEFNGESKLVKGRSIIELIDEVGGSVDHLEMNIEGGEYTILSCLIQSSYINRCTSVLVQFHNFGLEQELERAEIRMNLSKSHNLIYCYEWVWELWIKNDLILSNM